MERSQINNAGRRKIMLGDNNVSCAEQYDKNGVMAFVVDKDGLYTKGI